MFGRVSSSFRNSGRTLFHQIKGRANQQRRNMGGGGYVHISCHDMSWDEEFSSWKDLSYFILSIRF